MNSIFSALESHHRSGTHRQLTAARGQLDFSSNDYLGLANCSRVRQSLIKELEDGCPLGSTGSRLLSGQTIYHARVEGFLADIFQVQAALIFSSGFMANLGVLTTLGSLGADFFSDELNHASLVDGMRLTKSNRLRFRHRDTAHLEELLAKSSAEFKVVVTESVFSMDGDLAPLHELCQLAARYKAWLVVDEAHATGLYGPQGLGCLEAIPGDRSKIISIHPCGKALGAQGAFVLSSQSFQSLLINRARNFIFSTALSPLSALHIEYALIEVMKDAAKGKLLLKNAQDFRQALPEKLRPRRSQSPIIPILLGSNERACLTARLLQEKGFDVRAIRSPTVAKGTERLRVTLKSFHQNSERERLLQALAEVVS